MQAAAAQNLDRVFAALADPTRRAILARLADGEATVNELVAPFGFSQPTISKHLKVLEGAGLVSRGRAAQFRPVRLNAAPLQRGRRLARRLRAVLGGEPGSSRRVRESDASGRRSVMQASAVKNEPESEREVTITRVYDAPARLLFEAYSKPEHMMKWFGPKGWPLTLCEMDFRVGGRFRFAMTGPSGKQNTPFGGEYLEIVPNKKIVYDNGFETKGAGRMVVTVTYDEIGGGKTRLTIHTLFQIDRHVSLAHLARLRAGHQLGPRPARRRGGRDGRGERA